MATANSTCVNNGFQIQFSDNIKGRGMFARRSFTKGEIILEEDPFISCQFSWNASHGYKACEFCMRPLETAEENAKRLTRRPSVCLPFEDCCETNKNLQVACPYCNVMYCSSECKDKAWNRYHQILCTRVLNKNSDHPLEKLNKAWKEMHYPPETASIMMLAKILALIFQADEKDAVKNTLMQLCHKTVEEEGEIVHKLLGESFVKDLETLRDLTIKALGNSEISEFLTPEGFRSLFALIGRNGQGVGTSSFSVWVKNLEVKGYFNQQLEDFIDGIYTEMDAQSGQFLDCEGSALYLTQSNCNHSCRPNCEITFPYSNHRVVLVALRDIAENEELFTSYLDECILRRSRHSRRKALRENYLFNCECVRCQEEADQPDETSEDESDDVEDEIDDNSEIEEDE